MKKYGLQLVFGPNPDWQRVLLVLLTGLVFGIYTFWIQESGVFLRILGALVAADIGAGLVSNARGKAPKEWKNLGPLFPWIFVVLHLTVYPVVVILLISQSALRALLLGLLAMKVGFFAIGAWGK